MSSGNKLKVADQKFIFCQVCFYFRPFSLFQRNMKNKMNLCSWSTGVQRSKNQVLPIIICFRIEKSREVTERTEQIQTFLNILFVSDLMAGLWRAPDQRGTDTGLMNLHQDFPRNKLLQLQRQELHQVGHNL